MDLLDIPILGMKITKCFYLRLRLRLAWQSDCDEFEDIEKERDHLREKLAVAVEILEKIDLNCNSNMGIASFSDQCFINLITLPKEWIAEALAKIRGEK